LQPLVTPIEVIRFRNGCRILFRPKESSYQSSKEERIAKKQKEDTESLSAQILANAPGRRSAYVSPEAEAKLKAASSTSSTSSSTQRGKERAAKREGGLEVVVEESPYCRVRIKRCEMGPGTVAKEESEAILVKAILREVKVLEEDYKRVLEQMKRTL